MQVRQLFMVLKAGNGVIIVTTKRGKSGAAKVQYSGSASVQQIAKSYEMLDASGFMRATNDYTREQWMRTNGVGIYGGKEATDPSPAGFDIAFIQMLRLPIRLIIRIGLMKYPV